MTPAMNRNLIRVSGSEQENASFFAGECHPEKIEENVILRESKGDAAIFGATVKNKGDIVHLTQFN
jgi:hypothetical protein